MNSRSTVAILAAATAIAGVGTATIATASNRYGNVAACVAKSNGALRLSKHCHKAEKALVIAPKGGVGPRGSTGVAGPQGTAGAAGPDASDTSLQLFDATSKQVGKIFPSESDLVLLDGHIWYFSSSSGTFSTQDSERHFPNHDCSGTPYYADYQGYFSGETTYTLPGGSAGVGAGVPTTITAVAYSSEGGTCQQEDAPFALLAYNTLSLVAVPATRPTPILLRNPA